ncbi:hypothetical protein [Fimbriimonas ginsengisoli]|uniref:Uncharacterized protein n=1 Tax=Fimbriimonas ginsengisoli Gsoil 348 TaxID=661478 RepID=A0A068NND2_FIMGI|nr:hypothetical protein [Fimbriimonas ginsengisoli]AIE85043.1 hypothetical protein OP10G_1675 [Fimbriimonas ginsengisoli Gsoil 348]
MSNDRGERVALIVRTACLLFATAVSVGFLLADHREYRQLRDYAVLLGPIASATLIFIAVSLARPNLHAPGRLVFPLTITLPVVFVLLVRVSVVLWTSPEGSAFRASDALLPALAWTHPLRLAVLALTQCAVLTAFGSFWPAKSEPAD